MRKQYEGDRSQIQDNTTNQGSNNQQFQSETIKEKLRILETRSSELQELGKYGESLNLLEEALSMKIEAYGQDSEEVRITSEKLSELCNLIAMVCLTRERFDACFDFLKKAQTLSEHSSQFKAITYNNMACYYRRIGKVRTALEYLKKALLIENQIENSNSLADTHLNLCAVLSQLDRHSEALEHVLMSIILLQEEHMSSVIAQTSNSDRVAVLAIAFHNMGVELEFLKRFEEAISTYKKAVRFSITYLGESHSLVENLKSVLLQAENQILIQRNKEIKRRESREEKLIPKRAVQTAIKIENYSQKRQTVVVARPMSTTNRKGNFRISSAFVPTNQNSQTTSYRSRLNAAQNPNATFLNSPSKDQRSTSIDQTPLASTSKFINQQQNFDYSPYSSSSQNQSGLVSNQKQNEFKISEKENNITYTRENNIILKNNKNSQTALDSRISERPRSELTPDNSQKEPLE